jgi:hypothetical protein
VPEQSGNSLVSYSTAPPVRGRLLEVNRHFLTPISRFYPMPNSVRKTGERDRLGTRWGVCEPCCSKWVRVGHRANPNPTSGTQDHSRKAVRVQSS